MDQGPRGLAPVTGEAIGNSPSQTARKGVLLVIVVMAVALLFVGGSTWPDGGTMHEAIEWVGIALIVLCILGRTWSSLYIGGRKNQALVTHGPYSISRNPLYAFSIIGAVGVGAQIGSIVTATLFGLIAWAVFLWTARREEAVLATAFQEDYQRYLGRVPRFLPKLSLWHGPTTIEVWPRVIMTTFTDALVFLIAVPLAEGLEHLHEIGSLPVYLRLP
jgi:protein-S-isoprenylcysteine O-methyltransferase Ste14